MLTHAENCLKCHIMSLFLVPSGEVVVKVSNQPNKQRLYFNVTLKSNTVQVLQM